MISLSTTLGHVRKLTHFFCVTRLSADVVASAPGSAESVTWKWEASVTVFTAYNPL